MTLPVDMEELSRPGIRSKAKSYGPFLIISRSGAARWRLPEMSSSMERWTAGLKPSMRIAARCCGSSRLVRESSASRSAYKGPDGKQYVAILSGVGGWAGAIVAGGLDPRDESAASGIRRSQ